MTILLRQERKVDKHLPSAFSVSGTVQTAHVCKDGLYGAGNMNSRLHFTAPISRPGRLVLFCLFYREETEAARAV